MTREERERLKLIINEVRRKVVTAEDRMLRRSCYCAGCGTHHHNWTQGCKTCSDRHRRWARRGQHPDPAYFRSRRATVGTL